MDDDTRRMVFDKLEAWLGTEGARLLMSQTPPFRWEELATKRDLERFPTKEDLERFATKRDLERFPTKESLARFAEKQDVEQLRGEVREEFRDLRVELRERLALLQGLTQQTRVMVLVMAGTVAAVGALAVALAGLA